MTLRQPIRTGGRFPSWWQIFVIIGGALILCSCRAFETPYSAPTAPGVNTRWKPADAARAADARQQQGYPVQPVQYHAPMLPPQAATGYPGDGYTVPGWSGGDYIPGQVPTAITPYGYIAKGSALYENKPLAMAASGPECAPGAPEMWSGELVDGTQPWAPLGIRRPWPEDEYLRDGGDEITSVKVGEDFTVRGLELEDTVAHFDTIRGETIVSPSNKVAIYAPRFASVRRTTAAIGHEILERMAISENPAGVQVAGENQFATTAVKQLQPQGEIGMKGPSILRERAGGHWLDNTQRLAAFQDQWNLHENFNVIKTGHLDHGEGPRLAEASVAAQTWETKQAVQLVVDGKTPIVHSHALAAEETRLSELPPGVPQLCVTKTASRRHALPGEFVDFTIRFDNVGSELIGNVTLLDNLTTRLEYVPDSAQCSLPAAFFTMENEGESLVLRWEIKDPVPAGKGGVVRFRCKVR